MQQYEQIHQEELQNFIITTSITCEDTHPRDLFDYSEDEMQELCEKIDNGYLSWFSVRVEARKRGIILGSSYLGGCLYENPRDFINDAYYEDMVQEAINEAKKSLIELNEEWLIEQPLIA